VSGESYIKIACCVRETCFRKGGLGKLSLRKLHLNWDLIDLGGIRCMSSVEINRIGKDP